MFKGKSHCEDWNPAVLTLVLAHGKRQFVLQGTCGLKKELKKRVVKRSC